jgi:hypothetical protein
MGRGAPQTRQHTSDECSYTGYCPDLVTRPVWSNSSASIHGKKRNERTSTPSPRTRRHRLDFGPMKEHHIPRLPRNFSARLTGMSQLGAASSSYSLSCCILLRAYVRASMEDPYHPDLLQQQDKRTFTYNHGPASYPRPIQGLCLRLHPLDLLSSLQSK